MQRTIEKVNILGTKNVIEGLWKKVVVKVESKTWLGISGY